MLSYNCSGPGHDKCKLNVFSQSLLPPTIRANKTALRNVRTVALYNRWQPAGRIPRVFHRVGHAMKQWGHLCGMCDHVPAVGGVQMGGYRLKHEQLRPSWHSFSVLAAVCRRVCCISRARTRSKKGNFATLKTKCAEQQRILPTIADIHALLYWRKWTKRSIHRLISRELNPSTICEPTLHNALRSRRSRNVPRPIQSSLIWPWALLLSDTSVIQVSSLSLHVGIDMQITWFPNSSAPTTLSYLWKQQPSDILLASGFSVRCGVDTGSGTFCRTMQWNNSLRL